MPPRPGDRTTQGQVSGPQEHGRRWSLGSLPSRDLCQATSLQCCLTSPFMTTSMRTPLTSRNHTFPVTSQRTSCFPIVLASWAAVQTAANWGLKAAERRSLTAWGPEAQNQGAAGPRSLWGSREEPSCHLHSWGLPQSLVVLRSQTRNSTRCLRPHTASSSTCLSPNVPLLHIIFRGGYYLTQTPMMIMDAGGTGEAPSLCR